MNSPTEYAHMGDLKVRTPSEFDAFNAADRLHDARFENGGLADADVYYLISLEGELIGGVSLAQRIAKSGSGNGTVLLTPDIVWCLLEKYMEKGYATEAARELLRFAREEFGMEEVVAFASEGNPASNRVAEKLGFVDGGQCPDLDHPGGMLALYVLPGMKRIDEMVKDGLGFAFS